jgi:hypothetical protein
MGSDDSLNAGSLEWLGAAGAWLPPMSTSHLPPVRIAIACPTGLRHRRLVRSLNPRPKPALSPSSTCSTRTTRRLEAEDWLQVRAVAHLHAGIGAEEGVADPHGVEVRLWQSVQLVDRRGMPPARIRRLRRRRRSVGEPAAVVISVLEPKSGRFGLLDETAHHRSALGRITTLTRMSRRTRSIIWMMPPPTWRVSMRPLIVMLMVLSCGSLSSAQTTFVAGSLTGEVARFGSVETTPQPDFPRLEPAFDGEAVGFGLSLERSLGDRWGVALEFARPGTIEREDSYELPFTIAIFPPVPPVEIHRRFEQRRASVNTLAWLAQSLGDRVELAFLAGASFARTTWVQHYDVTVAALVLVPPGFIDAARPTTKTIEFSVAPVVGLDARLKVSDHLAVVPGVRFQAAAIAGRSGWLLRPSVGMRWGF